MEKTTLDNNIHMRQIEAFNLGCNSLKQLIFPTVMKRAEISPIFKKNDDMLKENFRPVSILAIFS